MPKEPLNPSDTESGEKEAPQVPPNPSDQILEEKAAYRLCYETLNVYFGDKSEEEMDEEQCYFNELEEWPGTSNEALSISLGSLPEAALGRDSKSPGTRNLLLIFCLHLEPQGDEKKGGDIPPLSDADFEEGGRLVDWNERFQVIVGKLRAFNYSTPLIEKFDTNRALIHLAQDFIYSSSR